MMTGYLSSHFVRDLPDAQTIHNTPTADLMAMVHTVLGSNGSLDERVKACADLGEILAHRQAELQVEARILHAQKTIDRRVQPHQDQWAVHMTHCYGVDDEGLPTSCKYGEDHVCPAALHKEPLKEYRRVEALRG